MKQLLILLAAVSFLFAQSINENVEELTEKFPGMFEISEEMEEKIERARARHREMMEEIKVMSAEEKAAYFNTLRKEAKIKMEAKLEELPPELQARIKIKMAEIKAEFNKKKVKTEDIKSNITIEHKAAVDIDIMEVNEIIRAFKSNYGNAKEK